MKQHRYRITVEHLTDTEGRAPSGTTPLVFEAGNHDDIVAIAQRMRSRGDLPPEAATAFAVGLKLFSEVMLEHRELPLFAGFAPHFRDFMRALKGGSKPG